MAGTGTGTAVGAISLDSTLAGASSNSYVSVADSATVLAKNSHITDIWSALGLAAREAALMYATEQLDQYIEWAGVIYTSTQALRHPRTGLYDAEGVVIPTTSIPLWLRTATAFFGYSLSQKDRTVERNSMGFKSVNVGDIYLTPDKYDRYQTIPQHILDMIAPYGWMKLKNRVQLVRY